MASTFLPQQSNPTIRPYRKEIDALISGTSKKVSIALQALKETGFRIGELWQGKWTDLDEEKRTHDQMDLERGLVRQL